MVSGMVPLDASTQLRVSSEAELQSLEVDCKWRRNDHQLSFGNLKCPPVTEGDKAVDKEIESNLVVDFYPWNLVFFFHPREYASIGSLNQNSVAFTIK